MATIVPPPTMPKLRLPEFGADDLAALLADVLARLDQLVANHPDRDDPVFTIPHRTSSEPQHQLDVEVGELGPGVWLLSYRAGYSTELQISIARNRDYAGLAWAGGDGPLEYVSVRQEDTAWERAVAGLWLNALRFRLYHWHAPADDPADGAQP